MRIFQKIIFAKSPTRRLPKTVGFTLIELLVVVSIISLLVSILLPSLSRAREQAKMVLCANNQKQLMLAQIYYAEDYGFYAGYNWNGSPPISRLYEYLSPEPIYRPYITPGEPINLPPYVCPSVPQAINGETGAQVRANPFGWNVMLGSYTYTGTSQPDEPWFRFLRPSNIRRPAELIGWAECKGSGIIYPPDILWGWAVAPAELRHMNETTSNAAFMDGHVQRVYEDEIADSSLYRPQN